MFNIIGLPPFCPPLNPSPHTPKTPKTELFKNSPLQIPGFSFISLAGKAPVANPPLPLRENLHRWPLGY